MLTSMNLRDFTGSTYPSDNVLRFQKNLLEKYREKSWRLVKKSEM